LEFSYEVLDSMQATYEKLKKQIAKLGCDGEVDEAVFASYKQAFSDAIADDLNTSMAVTCVYDVLKAETNDATKRALIESFDEVLSLDLTVEEEAEENGVDAEFEAYILQKIEERKAAKKEKNFALADAIRAELLEKGIILEDTREGVKWKKA
jgi:cysteinyl-tRNA synthetase